MKFPAKYRVKMHSDILSVECKLESVKVTILEKKGDLIYG